jgi:hypothetical protein
MESFMKITLLCAVPVSLLFLAQTCFSQVQTITSECTTSPTGPDGARHGCDSDVSRVTAPDGYVFSQNSLQGGETSGAGSEHQCRPGWDDYVEIIPGSGITQPRTLTLQSHALGPKGYMTGRGWVKCAFTANIAKYRS